MVDAKLLIKHGFIASGAAHKYAGKKPEEIDEIAEAGDADQESFEAFKGSFVNTGYPTPLKHLRLIMESHTANVEEAYFWVLNSLRNDWGFPDIVKIHDVFAASQSSSFFGHASARLGVMQDRAAQYLKYIGDMVKGLFQVVRELRALDERLDFYNKAAKGDKSAMVTLKGVYVDVVEGGSKNFLSVIGMAQQVGFRTLKDLFFSINPKTSDEVDELVETVPVNKRVKAILKRKLLAFMVWKEKTYYELDVTRKWRLKFLKQHYEVIRMYINWLRPYMKYTQMLSMDTKRMESPDLVSAFEGSMLEVEVMAKKKAGTYYYAVVIVNFLHRTSPTMPFMQPEEYRHKGPLHVGKIDINFRAYAWTAEQVQAYLDMKKEEDLELLKSLSGSIEASLTALGKDLENYLEEAGEAIEVSIAGKKKEEKPPEKNVWEEISKTLRGMLGPFKALIPKKDKVKKPEKPSPYLSKLDQESAAKIAKKAMWETYKNFKKAHGMLSW
ncbi:hypothetical protein KY330_06090 [Candidatus Woesearchaeota archaeon]|nr:hypothetical protein [Candidatus Woesearchaeota archaeon]